MKPEIRVVLSWLVIGLPFFPAAVSYAQDTVCDNTRLETAQAQFDVGKFTAVFDLMDPCLPDGFRGREQRVVAFRLMALSNIAVDSYTEAREWTSRLLKEDPAYRVRPETDPPRFAGLVDDLRPKWYTWFWRGNEWYKWVGRTAIVGSAVALPLVLKKTPEPDLPLPPTFPSR